MRKIFLALVSTLIFVGIVYALVPALFPDTAFFPRVPSGSGSIGGAIARLIGGDIETYTGTGVIENTLMLDGTTASGYLRSNTCLGTDKWIGIDANNRPICGTTSTLIGDFGTIDSQDCDTSNIYHESGSITNPTSTGFVLKSGDILKTPPGCTMTIAFTDLSILRLDGDTVVSFDIGSLSGGTSIATALLENGSLWGRILTETGSYSVGTHEIIAGVRGTSISLVSTGNTIGAITWTGTGWTIPRTPSTLPTEVTIVDTTTSTGAIIACKKPDGAYQPLANLSKKKSYMIPPGGCGGSVPSIVSRPKQNIFSDSPWAQKNTKKDIDYMYRKVSLSGATIGATKKTIFNNEIATTIPDNTLGTLTATGIQEANSLCATGEVYWNERYGCQANKVLAIADLTVPDTSVCTAGRPYISVYSGSLVSNVCPMNTLGTNFPGTGFQIGLSDYIEYSGAVLKTNLGGTFSGKIIRFELNDSPLASGTEKRVFQFSGTKYIGFNNNADKFNYDGGATHDFGDLVGGGTINVGGESGLYIFSVEPTYFIVGNDYPHAKGLTQKLKRIEIRNP